MKISNLIILIMVFAILLCACSPSTVIQTENEPGEQQTDSQEEQYADNYSGRLDSLTEGRYFTHGAMSIAGSLFLSSIEDKPFTKECALVKSVDIKEDCIVMTVDYVEERRTGDVEDVFFANAEEKWEDITINNKEIAFIVDPHIHYAFVTAEGFKTYMESYDIPAPIYIWRCGKGICAVSEMMLP